MKRSVILLAGGEGSRLGTKKQYIPLGGKPLYMHSLEKVLDLFEEAILVLPEEDLQKVKVPPKVKKVAGGKERQDSVLEGILEAVSRGPCPCPKATLTRLRKKSPSSIRWR
jgi:2-C-methyl-D-erythritol 4-phosphate cytidylyltransferase